MNSLTGEAPSVCVIVPVYNDPEGIRQCLDALTNQTYPDESYEIIVVDNDSTDETPSVIREFPAKLIFERDIQSSYAARNAGIDEAQGEILAFTDADCTPDEEWLRNGVRTLNEREADIAAGRVEMVYPAGKTAAERYAALGSMRNDRCEHRGVAKTANLFVVNDVFKKFEHFPERLISGGDVHWTGSAVEAGYKLVYAADAVVVHPARDFKELLKKKFRVGRGNVQMWNEQGENPYRIILQKISQLPSILVNRRTDRSGSETKSEAVPPDRDFEMTLLMYVVAVFATLAHNLGRFYAMTLERPGE